MSNKTPMPPLNAAVRSIVRASIMRPASAERAAEDLKQQLLPAVASEIRWAFTPPRTWLLGVLTNLVLAACWLAVQPLTPHGRHHDWVVLVGTYFASFILADVTTTNMLGADHIRVLTSLSEGVPLWRIMLIKNLALFVLVGVPTLVAAMALTVWMYSPAMLGVTVPNVLVPILTWMGVGNLISVLHPVSSEPLVRRWRQRHDYLRTTGWLVAITLPYALLYVADPMDGVGHRILWNKLPAAIGPVLGRDTKSLVHLAVALIVWVGGTILAQMCVRRRGLHIQ